MSGLYASAPLLTVSGGWGVSTTATTASIQPQVYNDVDNANDASPPSSYSSSSIVIIVIITISSGIIVFATIYLLIRFFSRRFHRSLSFPAEDVVSRGRDHYVYDHRNEDGVPVLEHNFFSSLPLFTFGSVARTVSSGDCAVCLSKFQPHDQLRLLPLCCHAFHAGCIDTWLSTNKTCPLCRSTVYPTESEVLNKILSADNPRDSFRVEIGSVSSGRDDSGSVDGRRSYSIGSFEYVVDGGYEVPLGSTHRRGVSNCTSLDKESVGVPVPEPPGENVATNVSGGRSWLRDYVDRLASVSLSSSAASFRSSGMFFSGSSRRSEVVTHVEDLEANGSRFGEEISELFRWLSGV